jgi:hypothetical protein
MSITQILVSGFTAFCFSTSLFAWIPISQRPEVLLNSLVVSTSSDGTTHFMGVTRGDQSLRWMSTKNLNWITISRPRSSRVPWDIGNMATSLSTQSRFIGIHASKFYSIDVKNRGGLPRVSGPSIGGMNQNFSVTTATAVKVPGSTWTFLAGYDRTVRPAKYAIWQGIKIDNGSTGRFLKHSLPNSINNILSVHSAYNHSNRRPYIFIRVTKSDGSGLIEGWLKDATNKRVTAWRRFPSGDYNYQRPENFAGLSFDRGKAITANIARNGRGLTTAIDSTIDSLRSPTGRSITSVFLNTETQALYVVEDSGHAFVYPYSSARRFWTDSISLGKPYETKIRQVKSAKRDIRTGKVTVIALGVNGKIYKKMLRY